MRIWDLSLSVDHSGFLSYLRAIVLSVVQNAIDQVSYCASTCVARERVTASRGQAFKDIRVLDSDTGHSTTVISPSTTRFRMFQNDPLWWSHLRNRMFVGGRRGPVVNHRRRKKALQIHIHGWRRDRRKVPGSFISFFSKTQSIRGLSKTFSSVSGDPQMVLVLS